MLTLFSCPKAFTGHFGVIQENAARSWVALGSDVQVVLIGDDDGTAALAAELGVEHVEHVARSEQGTPLISDIFRIGQERARHPLVGYLNADILLLPDFLDAMKTLQSRVGRAPPFLAVGRRWDLDVAERLSFAPGWAERMDARAEADGVLHGDQGIDYFCFSRGLLGPMPPFSVGRPLWDKWTLYRARAVGADVIDITAAVRVIHQNHDYSHAGGSREEVWSGPEAEESLRLAGGQQHLFTLQHANRLLRHDGVVRPLDAWHLLGRLEAAPVLHRPLRPLRWPVRAVAKAAYLSRRLRRPLGLVIDDPIVRDQARRAP